MNWKCPEMQKCPKTFVHDCSREVGLKVRSANKKFPGSTLGGSAFDVCYEFMRRHQTLQKHIE